MRLWAGFFLGILATAWVSPARAAPATRLVYARDAGTETCADEGALRAAVATRLGYDPFFPWAKITLEANVRREGSVYKARIALLDAEGIVRGRRDLESAHPDCTELTSAMALAISIALDLLDPRPPEPPPQEPPPPRDPEPAPSPPPPQDDVPPPDRVASEPAPVESSIDVGAGVLGGLGILPAANPGVDVFGRLRRGNFSIAIEGVWDASASKQDRFGAIARAYALGGAVVPCVHVSPLAFCALAGVSVFHASAAASGDAAVGLFGLRAAAEVPLSDLIFARLHVDGLVPMARTTLKVDGEELWTAPAAGARIGAGLAVRFR